MDSKHLICLGLLLIALLASDCSAPTISTPAKMPPTATPRLTAVLATPSPTPGSEVLMGFTADGAPYRGNPNAPVTLLEYGEFLCPYCARHAAQTGPLLYEAYIATGKVRHIFRQYLIHPQAQKASEAALCAAQQSAAAFWAMHDLLFARMQEWSKAPDATACFAEYAKELGLDIETFVACLESGEKAAQVQAETEQGLDMGVTSIPAFFINDWFLSGAKPFATFQQVIEAALRNEHPVPTPVPFASNPERPGYTYSGDITLGASEASLLLLEFVDFASEANYHYFLETWPKVKKRVDSGKLRVIIKHFPATDQASEAAAATECAGMQGTFWPMHDLLFQRQQEWSQADDLSALLKGYAAELGLEAGAFSACLAKGQTKTKVEQDVMIAQWNQLPPAPQFVLIHGNQSYLVLLEELLEAIDSLSQ